MDNEGNTYLMIAAKNGHLGVIGYLVSQGADIYSINRKNETVLMKATESKKLEVVKYFVSKSVNINATDEDGETALIKAVKLGCFDIVEYLVSKDIDINIANYNGNALMIAIFSFGHLFTDNRLKIVECLLQKGIKFNATSELEWTPLLAAISRLNDKVVEMLLQHGADPNHICILNLNALSLLEKYHEISSLSDKDKLKYNNIFKLLTVKN